MSSAEKILVNQVSSALKALYNLESEQISFQKTRKEFEGDFTLVTFPFTKSTKKKPEDLGSEIGDFLKKNAVEVSDFNVVKGFLNISLSDAFWLQYFSEIRKDRNFGKKPANSTGKHILLEYASPNTNKPIHLGHIRNNLLGYSMSEILKANGHKVTKSNLVNDRGIHICKSMLAWLKFGNGATPQSTGIKGDHLVGDYYVRFDKEYKAQIADLVNEGATKEEAEKSAPIILEAQDMLRKWETGDKATVDLWKTMNSWVYEGFDITFKELGVDFDKIYYESEMYLIGKKVVQEGLDKKIFYKKENGSVAIDLTSEGLDEKIVLRGDGTSVYITQDIGTAIKRIHDYPDLNQMIYTVGNEQDYHFKVLFKILEKLGYDWARECYHLSYGMVELPEGKMKSREGTVVDADVLLEEMYRTAESTTKELGKVEGFTEQELQELYKMVGRGALKYFILKVDPKKKMLFDPKESIDFNGHTGPFIQYTHARIRSVLRKAESTGVAATSDISDLHPESPEKDLIKWLYDFPAVVEESGRIYNPSIIANYAYELAKLFNRFYHELSVLKEEDEKKRAFRLQLCSKCSEVISASLGMLGIQVPERM